MGISSLPYELDYQVAEVARATSSLILLGPLHAIVCGYFFLGFPQLLLSLRPRRSNFVVAARYFGPLLLGVPLVGVISAIVATSSIPTSLASWSILAVAYAALFACGLLGLALVWSLPTFIALPLAGILSFVWLAFPGSWSHIMPRNMNSSFVGCCTDSQQPAIQMLVGSAVLTVGLSLGVAALFLFRSWPRWRRPTVLLLTALILTASTGASVAAIRSFDTPPNLLAVQPRATELVCVESVQATTCVWPERRERLEFANAIVADLNVGLEELDLPEVELATEAVTSRSGELSFSAANYLADSEVTFSIVVGYVEGFFGCLADGMSVAKYDSAVSLVAFAANVPDAEIADRVSEPSALAEAADALTLAPEQTRAWFEDLGGQPNPECQGP